MKLRKAGITIAIVLLASTAIAQEAPKAETAPYGQEMMTVQEREQYREQVRTADTEAERNRIRADHRKKMQERARERNIPRAPDVAAPGAGPMGAAQPGVGRETRGHDMMTEEERARHREEMRSKSSEEERAWLRKEKHEEMKKRAQEKGVTLPDEPLPRGRGMGGGQGSGPR